MSGPAPRYRPATSGPGGSAHHGIDVIDACLTGGLLKDEHQRVFLYVGYSYERYRLNGRVAGFAGRQSCMLAVGVFPAVVRRAGLYHASGAVIALRAANSEINFD